MKPLLWILSTLICLGATLQGQTYNRISNRSAALIDSTYLSLMKEADATGLSLAIVDNGEIVYSQGYGYADIEKAIPATDRSVYRIGSATKTFSALAVMQLVESGELELDTPVQALIPEWTPVNYSRLGKIPELKQVLSHTAGFPADLLNGFFADKPPKTDWTIRTLSRGYHPLDPNQIFLYSNVAYGLLEEVIERKSGLTYESFLRRHIFQPLGMSSTWVLEPVNDSARVAQGYLKGRIAHEPLIRDVSAGLIHSNVLDMSNFMLMLLDSGSFEQSNLLTRGSLSLMQTDHLTNLSQASDRSYGYGFQISHYNYLAQDSLGPAAIHVYGHGGNTLAYHCDYRVIPELGVGVVLLTNSDRGRRLTKATRLMKLFLELEKGGQMDLKNPPKRSREHKSRSVGEELIGHYSTLLGYLKITNPSKFKTWQGPAKIVFKLQEDSTYAARARLLGLIPIKVRDQVFGFESDSSHTFFTVLFPSTGNSQTLGIKIKQQDIPQTWLERTGKYKVSSGIFGTPEEFPFQLQHSEATLKDKNGFLVFTLKTPSKEFNGSYVMSVISDSLLVNEAYARDTGHSVSVDPDGNLFFSGMTFQKTK